jgi:hypothetical protein
MIQSLVAAMMAVKSDKSRRRPGTLLVVGMIVLIGVWSWPACGRPSRAAAAEAPTAPSTSDEADDG